MTLTLGGLAAIALCVALACMKKGVAKRSVVYLMLIAGTAGLGGAIGSFISRIVRSGVNGATKATDQLFGVGVGGLIAILVLTIFVYPHVKPKGQPPTRATPWLALAWGTVAIAVGGVFAAAAGLSANLFATGSNTVSGVLLAFFQGG